MQSFLEQTFCRLLKEAKVRKQMWQTVLPQGFLFFRRVKNPLKIRLNRRFVRNFSILAYISDLLLFKSGLYKTVNNLGGSKGARIMGA